MRRPRNKKNTANARIKDKAASSSASLVAAPRSEEDFVQAQSDVFSRLAIEAFGADVLIHKDFEE